MKKFNLLLLSLLCFTTSAFAALSFHGKSKFQNIDEPELKGSGDLELSSSSVGRLIVNGKLKGVKVSSDKADINGNVNLERSDIKTLHGNGNIEINNSKIHEISFNGKLTTVNSRVSVVHADCTKDCVVKITDNSVVEKVIFKGPNGKVILKGSPKPEVENGVIVS